MNDIRETSAFWTDIATLSGQTLQTLGQRKDFDIVLIDSKGAVVRPHTNGVERRIKRKEFEGAFTAMGATGQIDLGGIRRHSEMNPVYVAAMIGRLPYVSVNRKPKICLSLQSA